MKTANAATTAKQRFSEWFIRQVIASCKQYLRRQATEMWSDKDVPWIKNKTDKATKKARKWLRDGDIKNFLSLFDDGPGRVSAFEAIAPKLTDQERNQFAVKIQPA